MIADTYLREARSYYACWGAEGKVRQIDQQNPRLLEGRTVVPTGTFTVRPEELDLLSVTKTSQTISGEIVLDSLVRTLLVAVLEQGGAQRACLVLIQDGSLSLEAEASLENPGVVTTRVGALSMDAPHAPHAPQRIPTSLFHYVQRTKERVILSDAAADAGRFSGEAHFTRDGPRSVLCMPILRQAEMVGLLYLENNLIAFAFTPHRLAALELLATQAAISLQNALLLAKEQSARAAAEEGERRSAFLAEAGRILSESLDCEDTLGRLGKLCAQSLCDWCVIEVVEGDEIEHLSGAHKDPAKANLLVELQRRYPPRWTSPHPAIGVLRTGEPSVIPVLDRDRIRQLCVDDEHARLCSELDARSAIIVPLVARGQTLGALSVVSSEPGRRYGHSDLALVEEVARRASIAIDNARLHRKAQDAIRARDEFLTVATHELNTPMTSLTLTLQALAGALEGGRPLDPQATGRRIERALRQATRLTHLISELLDVARIQGERLPLELSNVDLGALVHGVVEQFKLDLARAGSSVSIGAGRQVVGLWDGSRLEQVVTNLLANAIKFGGRKPIEILFGEEAGTARLVVKDHGIGIDPARQEHIFERFERAVSDRHYGGLGLGLYISRRIAEAHGGAIQIQSELGAGATFTVELPCAGPSAADLERGWIGELPRGAGRRLRLA